jgi:hypothetical protein
MKYAFVYQPTDSQLLLELTQCAEELRLCAYHALGEGSLNQATGLIELAQEYDAQIVVLRRKLLPRGVQSASTQPTRP